jgi:hypothetical protein
VFSDESWLSCNEVTGKVQWCRKKDDAIPREKKARWNVASIMVWAAVGYNFKSELIIFPAKQDDDGTITTFRLDAARYVKRCLSTVMAQVLRQKRIFQHDGARSHMAGSTKGYLKRKGVQWMEDWPAYSADLNMIEPVWKELNELVGARCPMTQSELVEAARMAWKELPQSVINAHCKHFKTQVGNVLSATRKR